MTVRRWYLTEAGRAAGVRRRLDAVVRGAMTPDASTTALASLVRETRMDRALYPGRDRRADRSRLEQVGRDQPVGTAVGKAIQTIEAVNAAVTVSVAVAASGAAGGGHGRHGGR